MLEVVLVYGKLCTLFKEPVYKNSYILIFDRIHESTREKIFTLTEPAR